jgi:hypothetical protein
VIPKNHGESQPVTGRFWRVFPASNEEWTLCRPLTNHFKRVSVSILEPVFIFYGITKSFTKTLITISAQAHKKATIEFSKASQIYISRDCPFKVKHRREDQYIHKVNLKEKTFMSAGLIHYCER